MAEVYVDDASSSITYSGDWQFSTDSQRSYDNTVHYTNAINSKATITFTGISAAVYGIVRSEETPQSSYSIDGGGPTIFSATSQALTLYGAVFYTTPALSNGQHTLIITNLNNTNSLFIDYFLIVSTNNTSTSSSSTVIPSTIATIIGSTSTSSTSTLTRTSSLSSSTTLVSSSSSSSDIPPVTSTPETTTAINSTRQKAAIIGAVGALTIIAIFTFFCLWLRHRHRKESDFWMSPSTIDSPVVPTVGSSPTYDSDSPQRIEQTSSLPVPDPRLSEPPPYMVADPSPGVTYLRSARAALKR